MRRVRDNPPTTLGGVMVSDVIDLELGVDGLAPTEGLLWRLGERGRVVVRPSGTEPKLKAYIEVVGDPTGELDLERQAATALLGALREDLTRVLALDAR